MPKKPKVLLDIATGMAGYLHQEHVCISRAVDTVELHRRAFVKNLEIENIAVGSEELIRDEGQKLNVSTIEIIVTKTRSKWLLGKQIHFSIWFAAIYSLLGFFPFF